jgi:hypothetical protein
MSMSKRDRQLSLDRALRDFPDAGLYWVEDDDYVGYAVVQEGEVTHIVNSYEDDVWVTELGMQGDPNPEWVMNNIKQNLPVNEARNAKN